MSRSLVVVLALLAAASLGGCGSGSGSGQADPTARTQSVRFSYDASGRLVAVQDGATTAVYRYDAAGNRVGVDHVQSRDLEPAKVRSRPAPRITGLSPLRLAQDATVTVSGRAFAPDLLGNAVSVGGALGRVVSATPTELRVQLPPGSAPGPVTVTTAYGRSTSRDVLAVAPAEVDAADVTSVVAARVGRPTTLPGDGLTMVTFRGSAGATARLSLATGHAGCESTAVGLAGPTGTVVEARAGEASWCGRPARLPMTGTYVATVSHSSDLRITVSATRARGLPSRPVPSRPVPSRPVRRPSVPGRPTSRWTCPRGPWCRRSPTWRCGGSGAADLTRSFSVGDPDLPTFAPEQPLARRWSLGASLGLQPSASYSFLDVVMPDGLRLPYRRVTPGTPGPVGAVFEPTHGLGPGPFVGSRVSYTGAGWELRTRTGMVLGFGRTGSPLRLSWIRDQVGRTARFIRAPDDDGSPDGELRGVVSEAGQWARFTYDDERRIIGAVDQVGDVVGYRYARPEGTSSEVLVEAGYRPPSGPSTRVGYRYQPLTGRLVAAHRRPSRRRSVQLRRSRSRRAPGRRGLRSGLGRRGVALLLRDREPQSLPPGPLRARHGAPGPSGGRGRARGASHGHVRGRPCGP